MTLGSDVSRLSTTAAGAVAQGLSIVVPLYNEAAGLALLHERLVGLARTLKARYGLASEVVYVDDGSADNTLAIAHTLNADALDIQVVSLSRNFGKEAALMAGLDHARRGATCSWTVTASIRLIWSKSWSRTGSMTATTSSIRRRRIATMNRSCAARRCTASTR